MKEFELDLLNTIIATYSWYLEKWAWRWEIEYLWRYIDFDIYANNFKKDTVTVRIKWYFSDIKINEKIISWIYQEFKHTIINNLDLFKKTRN